MLEQIGAASGKLAGPLLCLFFWCLGTSALAADSSKNFQILATTFPIYQFTANICDNVPNVSLELLVPAAAGCPHDFAPSPADMRKLAGASALVMNGAGLEDFLQTPLRNVGADARVIDAAAGIRLLDDAARDHANPHIFAAPREAAIMAANIAAGLARADPANAALYKQNAAKYRARLEKLSADFALVGAKAKNRGIALEHDALAYLAENAGLEILAIFEDSSSAAALGRLQKELKDRRPALLAGDAQYSGRLIEMLSKDTGIPFSMLDPCASGPADAPLDYYEKVMEKNLKSLEVHFD